MKILVTGATGFIGNYLITNLLNGDNEIIATAIEEKENINYKWIGRVTYIQHDLNKTRDDYFQYFQKPDKLIHLSWEGLPNYKELFHLEKNLISSYYFIKNLVLNGCEDVTVLGTCLEYGMQNGKLSEYMPTNPSNPYSLAKDTLRKFLEELNKHYPYNLKWVRLFYLYGKGQNKNSILEQLKLALERNDKSFNMSGGDQLRDYLPVETAAEYITKIALRSDVNGIINCCSGNPISIRNLVDNYLKTQSKIIKLNLGYYPYTDYEPMAFWGDNRKLKGILESEK